MTDRAGGDGSRRPTKAERKDQARIEREQIQRQMAARKRNRNIGIVVIALAVVAVLVVVLVLKPGSDPASSDGASPRTCWLRRRTPRHRPGATTCRRSASTTA